MCTKELRNQETAAALQAVQQFIQASVTGEMYECTRMPLPQAALKTQNQKLLIFLQLSTAICSRKRR
jgi:hypothetical protein